LRELLNSLEIILEIFFITWPSEGETLVVRQKSSMKDEDIV